MKTKQNIKATSVRKLLTVVMIIVSIASIAGYYYTQQGLTILANEVKQAISKSPNANISNNVQTTKQLQAQIARYQPIATQLDNLSIPSDNAKNQIMQDLGKYASANGITVSNYNFNGQSGATGSSGGLSSGNQQTVTVTISISNSISYAKFLKFLKSIESNLPKMQITSLSVNTQGNSNNIKIDSMAIEAYTR